tara:strand:- start:338 stop:547 length:210 start_codon:yes stop_codon:yes gene_type:complete
MIGTVKELIEQLKQLDPDETLIYTYWGDEDYKDYKDLDQAISLIDDGLDTCIGHVNDYLESQYDEREGE